MLPQSADRKDPLPEFQAFETHTAKNTIVL